MPELRIQPSAEELTPGEVARIPFVVVAEGPLRARGLHATFHGAEESKASFTTYNAATKSTQTHTAIEHADVVKEEYLISGRERRGFFGNLTDGLATLVGAGEHAVLPAGEYPGEIEVRIPADAPPSFEGKKCRVFYELSLLLDIPLGRDLRALQAFRVRGGSTAELPVPGPVRVRYPEDQERGRLEAWLAPDVCAELALEHNTFRAGDVIAGRLRLEAPKPLEFRAIRARLLSVETTAARGHTDQFVHAGEPVTIAQAGVLQRDESLRFELPVSIPGPGSARGRAFSVDCFLEVVLDVPWARDPAIRAPIALLGG